MFDKIITPIRREISSFSFQERRFFLLILPCILFVMAEYGATRPVSNSLVLTYYSSAIFPYLWLTIVPFNFAIVYLYNKYLVSLGCVKIFFLTCFFISLINSVTGAFSKEFPILAPLQYIWKDIYILLVLKQIWSMVHSTVDKARAKYFYGIILLVGSFGSLIGNFIPGFLALKITSERIFYFSIPLYLIAFCFYYFSHRYSQIPTAQEDFEKFVFADSKDSKGAFSLFKNSRPLLFILAIVILMQFSTAIIYYQFNVYLEQAFSNTDLRTQYGAKLQSIINLFSIFFQGIGGFAFLYFFGLKRSHFLIPLTFIINGVLFLYKPMFSMITFFFAFAKAIDFSFFTLIKEMLFVPLTINEKFRAKAIIDIFAYRSAKGAASLLLIVMQAFSINMVSTLSVINLTIFISWAFLVHKAFQNEFFERELS